MLSHQLKQSSISKLECKIIDFVVNASQAIGLPKSVGKIYGLSLVSSQSLALDDAVKRLESAKRTIGGFPSASSKSSI